MELHIHKLNTIDQWFDCRASFKKLEAIAAVSPFTTWAYWFHLWSEFLHEDTCWLLKIIDTSTSGNELIAAGIWHETQWKRGPFSLKVLRALDQMVMYTEPLIVLPQHTEEAYSTLASNISAIKDETGAHLVTLGRQDANSASSLAKSLRKASTPVRVRHFTNRQIIDIGESIQAYFKPRKKLVRDILRRERKMVRETGKELRFVQGHTKKLQNDFLRLRQSSWQYLQTISQKRTSKEALDAFYEKVSGEWLNRGVVEYSLLYHGDTPVAGYLCIRADKVKWVLYTAFDRTLRNYGVGCIIFLKLLEASQANNERVLDLGGEAIDWKERWTSRQEALVEVVWPLGTCMKYLWGAAQQLKGVNIW